MPGVALYVLDERVRAERGASGARGPSGDGVYERGRDAVVPVGGVDVDAFEVTRALVVDAVHIVADGGLGEGDERRGHESAEGGEVEAGVKDAQLRLVRLVVIGPKLFAQRRVGGDVLGAERGG